MLLQVEVPAGLISGDPFNVEAGGLNFEICVPDGVGGGDLIDVDLPIDVPETPTTEQAGAQPLLVPVTLTVPDGVFPGMEMAVEWGGVSYNIAVPNGVGPGQEITVELPALDGAPPATPGMTPVTLTVPDGMFPGMEMAVEWGGISYNIAVPDGVGPGQEITVELPSLDGPPPEESAPTGVLDEPLEAELPDPNPDDAFEMMGRRVELKGLVAKAVLNKRKGCVIDYDHKLNRPVVMIDCLEPEVAVQYENLTWLPESDEAEERTEEPPEALPAGLYFQGDKVNVTRSNGDITFGIIVEYDMVFETYTVSLGGEDCAVAILKYGVEESYLEPIEMSQTTAGDFVVGRKVRVPRLGGHLRTFDERDDARNGRLQAFDAYTNTYTIHMADGTTQTGIPRQDIMVAFDLKAIIDPGLGIGLAN